MPIQAVLVANVSFLGYVTPPGGLEPYWENCVPVYQTYRAFLILNGRAFLFALGATGEVVVVPWLYPEDNNGDRHLSVNRWIAWGLGLLVTAILVFTAAFVCAGLVTGDYEAPMISCGVLPCDRGGVPCNPDRLDNSMTWMLSLNNIYGECFVVTSVTTGRRLLDALDAQDESTNDYFGKVIEYQGSGHRGNISGAIFDEGGCYLVVTKADPSDRRLYSSNTKNVLCTAGVKPGDPLADSQEAQGVSFQDALVNLTYPGKLWLAPHQKSTDDQSAATTYYFMLAKSEDPDWCSGHHGAGVDMPAGAAACACSSYMLEQQDNQNTMFVTHDVGVETGPQVFIASIMDNSSRHNSSITQSSASYGFDLTDINKSFGQELLLYWPGLFLDTRVAVYDEFKYRCNDFFTRDSRKQTADSQPTLCLFNSDARDKSPKWYTGKDQKDPSSMEKLCSAQNKTQNGGIRHWLTRWPYHPEENDGDPYNYTNCKGLAVDMDGNYIMISDLASLGTEVQLDEQWLASLGTQTSGYAFGILVCALLLYTVIAWFFSKVQCKSGR